MAALEESAHAEQANCDGGRGCDSGLAMTFLEVVARTAFRGCVSLMALCAIAQCRAQATEPVEPDVSFALKSIVHFTKWPGDRTVLRMCVAESDVRAAGQLERTFAASDGEDKRVLVVPLPALSPPTEALIDCQVVWFGAMSSSLYRPVLLSLAGRPVLTVGLGDDFCSFGGLFCLEAVADSARLKANLDSIAGSGLHVNPQLLRLTQRTAKYTK